MKGHNNIFICCMILLLIILSSSGCMATLSSRSSITSESVGNNKITLMTVSMFGDTDHNTSVYEQITMDFIKEYHDIHISDESKSPTKDWKTKITADFAAGNEPDVIMYFTDENADEVLASDKFVTIDEIREIYPQYASDINPDALTAAANPDGIKRAVPILGYWEGLYCNKDLFDKYDIPLPWDLTSLLYAIEIFKLNNVIPISAALSSVPHYWIEFMLLNYSGPKGYNTIPENAPNEWIAAIEMIRTLYEAGAFPWNTDIISNVAANNLFIEKKAAMILNGSWFLSGIPDQNNTVVIKFPNISNHVESENVIIGGVSTGFYITKKAWNDPERQEAAVKFVMAHTNKDSIYKYWRGIGQAVSDVPLPENMTPLALSSLEYYSSAAVINTPIDSKITHEAYNIFANELIEVIFYNKSARELINEVLLSNSKSKPTKK